MDSGCLNFCGSDGAIKPGAFHAPSCHLSFSRRASAAWPVAFGAVLPALPGAEEAYVPAGARLGVGVEDATEAAAAWVAAPGVRWEQGAEGVRVEAADLDARWVAAFAGGEAVGMHWARVDSGGEPARRDCSAEVQPGD